MDFKINVIVILLIITLEQHLIYKVNGACTWPAEFVSTQWHDSSRGIITFDSGSMQGWTFSPTTMANVSSWDCVSVSTYSTDGRIIMITSQPFSLFSTNYYAYLCITVTKVTESSYRYYINHAIQGNINFERLFIYPVSTLTDQGTICSDSGASGGEYQMLIKDGQESGAKIDCPWHFLGRYGYTHTVSGGSTTCDQSSSEIDMCTDTQEMKFDKSACATNVAYSVSDTLWCVDNIAEGGTNYVMVFNGNDADSLIDNQSIFRFTCMAVSGDATSASVSPRYCQNGQTPHQYPSTASGQTRGALLAFSNTTETCPTCPPLTDPDQGSVSISTMGSVTSALYTCDANYTLWGTSTRTCQSDITWTGAAPSCSCETPPTPSNGAVNVNSDGTVATYTCNVGYSLNGLRTRNCQTASATWEDDEPNCANCDAFTTINGQTFTLSTNGTDTAVSFLCAPGYTLSGSSSLFCLADGSWNSQQPNCVSCDTLTNPTSGSVILSTSGGTTTATYTCSSGYTLQGDATRTCKLDGTWNNAQPACVCNQPNSPSNGAVVANGQTATYTCNVGFTLNGDDTRTCQTDGSGWSSTDPQCSACNTLSSVTGGSYSISTTGTVTSAKYSCQVGYSLAGVTTITCQSDGSWGSSSPSCIFCPVLNNPSSGTVTLSTSGTKTSATYTCASGYNLNGNSVRLCNSDGTWSLMEPTCTCKSPAAPLNGLVTDDGATATYNCDQGYSLSGSATRICNTDGTSWSGSDSTCNVCETLPTPTGGTVIITTDGVNSRAAFTCSNGYTLNGVSPITCRSDGSWDFTAPACSKCPDLSDPDSGTLTMSTSGSITTATFTCHSGYYLNGASTLTCGPDSLWSSDSPTCKCNFPAQPSNGEVSVSGTGSVATYSCDTGYSLNGLSARTCQTDSTGWEGSDPSCTVCKTVSNPTSGTFSLSSNGTHTTVIYACDVGTTLNGIGEQVCTANGSWESTPPTCSGCPTLATPGSGSVALSTTSSSTIATFSCVTGYSLNSSSVLTCTSAGTWDFPSPYCICNSPSTIANGEISLSDDLRTATYTCNVGYVLVGSVTRNCQDNGSGWDGISPVCVLCPSLTDPSSGTVTLSTSGTQTMATYSCLSGYSLNGDAERMCNSDGTWSLMEPTCTCETPAHPLNGVVVDDGKTASYLCNQGYSISGAAIRTCGADGTGWSGTAPTCTTCDTLSTPSGGAVSLSTDGLNTQASYTCNNGYTLNGVNLITCRSDGSWDFTEPTCVKCPELSDPDSGTLTLTTTGFMTTATFSCHLGYYLKGEFSISCGTDGTWSDDAPSCKCDFPTQPSNGHVSLSSTGTVATYTCDTGYTLNGLSARTCQNDGTGWEGLEPVCTLCQTLSNPVNGAFSLTTSGTQTTASYACAVGTSLNGMSQIVCNADGSWQSIQPTCVQCPVLSDPDSGYVSLSTSGLTTTADFSCITGYTINSTSTLTCLSSGIWDIPSPFCICQSPPLLSNGQFNISADLQTVAYTCNIGYVLVGSVTRTCQNDGTGWDGISPVCDTETPDTGAATDGSVWNIPIAAMIVVILLFVATLLLLIGITYLYCQMKNEKLKIRDSEVTINTDKIEEELPEPKPTGDKATLLKKYNKTESRPSSSLTTTSIFFANGPPALPVRIKPQGKVMLPPISHVITEKRGTKRKGQTKHTNKGKNHRGNDGTKPVKETENDMEILRTKTPDLLHADRFDYIQPVYSYELETGRDSVLSRKGKKIKTKKTRAKDTIPINGSEEDNLGDNRANAPDLLRPDELNYIQPAYSNELEKPVDSGRENVPLRKEKKNKTKKQDTK